MTRDERKVWRVTYRDPGGTSPHFTLRMRGYDREDVEVRFIESNDGDDWQIVKIEEVRQ